MTLEQFLLLKDPIDKYGRSAHHDEFLPTEDGRSNRLADDYVRRYYIAKTSWEKYGDEGPSAGTVVEWLRIGGEFKRLMGIFDRDPRYFELRSTRWKKGDHSSIVLRAQWWLVFRVKEQN